MNLIKLAIGRPFGVAVVFLIAVLLGIFSLLRLPIDLMPDITYPTLTVSTDYAGVGPEEIETLLTRPIEEAVSAVQGLEEVTSTSVEGRSQVRLSFGWGTDLDAAAEDIRSRLDRIRNTFPEEASPPNVRKFDLAATPVVFLAVSGDMDPLKLKRLAEDQVAPRLERQPGVASVDIRGGLDREIRVEVDRQKLAALGLTLDQVSQALGRENLNAPAGQFVQGGRELGLRVRGEFQNLEEIKDTAVATRNGQAVRVRDLGVVVDSYQDVTNVVRINGVPSLQLNISKQAGTNTVQVAEGVLREVEALNHDLRGAHVNVTNDTSRFIKRSIHHISNDLLFGSALAVLVLMFFLRNIRSTLIVATAIPISVICTFALLYSQNFSLNTMSLGGLALGIGRLVDDAIVVIENIYRHRHMGKPPKEAALDGTRQVSLAIVASTATTLAVFVPLIFLTGMTGVMFKQLSLVVVFALTCSLIVAQALVPMLASRFLKDEREPEAAPVRAVYDQVGRWLQAMDDGYARTLRWAFDHSKRLAATVAVLTVGSLALVPLLGSEFMPTTDEGEVRVNVEMAPGTPLATMEQSFSQLEAIAQREVPEARLTLSEIGGGGWRATGSNTGSVRLYLVDGHERARSSQTIANALRRKLASLPGMTTRVTASGGNFMMRIGSSGDDGKLGVQVRGHDFETARALVKQVQAAMEATPGLADVRAEREEARPETVVHVDRAKAAALGVSVNQVAQALETAVLGRRASMFREGGDEFAITVRLREDQRRALADALDVPVVTAAGQHVLLRDMVVADASRGPSTINRENQERVMNVSAELTGRDLGGTVAALKERLAAISVPSDFQLVVTGDFDQQQKSFMELMIALGLALLLVYLVMVAQFESIKDPFIIFFSVPACVIGVVAMLMATGTTLNVQSFIGLIVLVGIAVSNGIVMVDYINQMRREEGRPLDEAVYEGARLRLRPVLMTSICTVLAMVPMALGLGEGGELQAPMARVVIGGLLTSTAITLFLVPIVYRWLDREKAPAATAPLAAEPVEAA